MRARQIIELREVEKQFSNELRTLMVFINSDSISGTQLFFRIESALMQMANPIYLAERRLNIVMNFCDEFCDALNHGFEDVQGIPIEEAKALFPYLIDCLETGKDIEDERLQKFYIYCPPSKGFIERIMGIFRKKRDERGL